MAGFGALWRVELASFGNLSQWGKGEGSARSEGHLGTATISGARSDAWKSRWAEMAAVPWRDIGASSNILGDVAPLDHTLRTKPRWRGPGEGFFLDF